MNYYLTRTFMFGILLAVLMFWSALCYTSGYNTGNGEGYYQGVEESDEYHHAQGFCA